VAWAASKKKGSYLRSKYRKLAPRIGKKRALIAIAHKILVSIYHILKKREPYKELGESYLDQLNKGKIAKHLCQRLQDLGYDITIASKAPTEMEATVNA
jgi:transposase